MKYKFYCNVCKKKVKVKGEDFFNAGSKHLRSHLKAKVGDPYDILGAILKLVEISKGG